jgi:hypothetical protein
MTTIRVAKRERFTTVTRATVNDKRLSFRARGVLFWLLDKPNDWSVDAEAIARHGKEGREAVRTALRELEKAGYLVRLKTRDENGQFRTDCWVYERPMSESDRSGFLGAGLTCENDAKPQVGASTRNPSPVSRRRIPGPSYEYGEQTTDTGKTAAAFQRQADKNLRRIAEDEATPPDPDRLAKLRAIKDARTQERTA